MEPRKWGHLDTDQEGGMSNPILSGKAAVDYLRGRVGRDGITQQQRADPGEDDDVFYCDEVEEVTRACPIYKGRPTLSISPTLLSSLIGLAGRMREEWLAYLKGRYSVRTGRGRITSVYFPPQEVSAAHCEPDNHYRPRRGTIGVIHSHAEMEAFFSTTDVKHMNWPVEIVINSRAEYQLMARVRLRCGEIARVEGEFDEENPASRRLEEELVRVQRKTAISSQVAVTDLTQEDLDLLF